MKILLVGSGGREHTLAWKLSQSPTRHRLLIAPGNPGTARIGTNCPVSAEDVDGLLNLAREQSVDLTIVGPEAPLVSGLVDRFREAGLQIAGPTQKAAALEGSKVFAKDFMRRQGIPTGAYRVFREPSEAERRLQRADHPFPIVLKADGLAGGKGVFVCRERAEALEAVDQIMRRRRFGSSGDRLLVEEFLEGEEASFMVVTDGDRVIPLPPSQDHKAAYDGDKGPNTGGMGAYSTDSILSPSLKDRILDEIIHPAVQGMREEGHRFSGVLYAGLMLSQDGPKVLEFNVRLGDPEAQVVLPRLDCDLVKLFAAVAREDLRGFEVGWSANVAVCVVLASQGYPGPCRTGMEIAGLELAEEVAGTTVFHAGTGSKNGKTVVAGGRVLGVTALGESLEAALMQAYEGVNKIHFDGMHYRRDIAARGLRG